MHGDWFLVGFSLALINVDTTEASKSTIEARKAKTKALGMVTNFARKKQAQSPSKYAKKNPLLATKWAKVGVFVGG